MSTSAASKFEFPAGESGRNPATAKRSVAAGVARHATPSAAPCGSNPESLDMRASRLAATVALLACAMLAAAGHAQPQPGLLGNFIRSMNESSYTRPLQPNSAPLAGATHYRLVPGLFPQGMEYHFDGLATVMSFRFDAQQLTVSAKYYASEAEQHYSQCIFEGTGTGPTLGFRACLTNPGVNLLPLNNQLWLTIDTAFWGRGM